VILDRRLTPEEREGPAADSGPGMLFASVLIAGGSIVSLCWLFRCTLSRARDDRGKGRWRR